MTMTFSRKDADSELAIGTGHTTKPTTEMILLEVTC